MAQLVIGFNSTTGNSVAGTSNTFSHTIAGDYPILFVFVYHGNSSDLVTGITYAGNAMTRLNTRTAGTARAYLYYQLNPAQGSNNVVVTTSGSVIIEAQAWSYTNVNQAVPEAQGTNANTSGTSSSLTLTTITPNAWMISGFKANGGGVSAGANTNNRGGLGNPASFDSGAVSTPGNRTLNANHNTGNWVWCGAVIAPAETLPSASMFLVF